jgi:3-deoxy-manno-octulosonate cytidylyltransferase (CMP-KDO synthetase)
MIQHVVEQCQKTDALSITVATDDLRIADAVAGFGAKSVMTSQSHESGSDRIAEACSNLNILDNEIVVNVQGDEPDMPPLLIRQVAESLFGDESVHMATASAPIENQSQLRDSSVVKVVTNSLEHALYFSRATIPFVREEDEQTGLTDNLSAVRRHLGIYAYRAGYIKEFASRPACELEKLEKLEQLRALWAGEKIKCVRAIEIPGPGIDTLEDLERIRKQFDE